MSRPIGVVRRFGGLQSVPLSRIRLRSYGSSLSEMSRANTVMTSFAPGPRRLLNERTSPITHSLADSSSGISASSRSRTTTFTRSIVPDSLCDQGMRYGCASVCIPPCHVAGAKKYVGDRLRICTVIGFPNGYNTPAVKAFEAAEAIRNGADEVDMVINLAMVKDGCWDDVAADIRAVREVSRGRILKVIIECCLLTEEEKRMLCRIVSDSGADYIKTSTGFSTGGATADDVRLLRTCCPPHVKVKAAGGIASLADAEEFIRLGADRLGTSRIVKIAMAQEQQAAEAAAAPQQPEAAAQPETPAQPQAPEQQDTTY